FWVQADGFRFARMGGVVVDRLVDGLRSAKRSQMIDQQVIINCIRMIEINLMLQLKRHVAEISIIGVLLEINDILRAHRRNNLLRNGSLTGTGPTANTYYHID